jgi:hypothetical protein
MAQIVFMIFRVVVESLKRLDGSFRVHGEYKLVHFFARVAAQPAPEMSAIVCVDHWSVRDANLQGFDVENGEAAPCKQRPSLRCQWPPMRLF